MDPVEVSSTAVVKAKSKHNNAGIIAGAEKSGQRNRRNAGLEKGSDQKSQVNKTTTTAEEDVFSCGLYNVNSNDLRVLAVDNAN